MTSAALTLGLFQQIGWPEMLIVLGIGVLLFGRRLPEIGRGIGKGIVEFKRGIKDINDDIEDESRRPAPSQNRASGQGTPGQGASDGGWQSAGGDPHARGAARDEPKASPASLSPATDAGAVPEGERVPIERDQNS